MDFSPNHSIQDLHSHALSCETLNELYSGICSKFPEITCSKFYSPRKRWLVLFHPQRSIHRGVGPLQNPRLCLACDGTSATYQFQVFFKTDESSLCDPKRLNVLSQQLLPSSEYVICPGIPDYPQEIRFKMTHLHEWGQPFGRLDADACALWHIPDNARQHPTSPLYNACKQCKQLHHDIQQLLKKTADVTTDEKLARVDISSNYPLKYLSPASAKKRVSERRKSSGKD